jgi:hypothetical protein
MSVEDTIDDLPIVPVSDDTISSVVQTTIHMLRSFFSINQAAAIVLTLLSAEEPVIHSWKQFCTTGLYAAFLDLSAQRRVSAAEVLRALKDDESRIIGTTQVTFVSTLAAFNVHADKCAIPDIASHKCRIGVHDYIVRAPSNAVADALFTLFQVAPVATEISKYKDHVSGSFSDVVRNYVHRIEHPEWRVVEYGRIYHCLMDALTHSGVISLYTLPLVRSVVLGAMSDHLLLPEVDDGRDVLSAELIQTALPVFLASMCSPMTVNATTIELLQGWVDDNAHIVSKADKAGRTADEIKVLNSYSHVGRLNSLSQQYRAARAPYPEDVSTRVPFGKWVPAMQALHDAFVGRNCLYFDSLGSDYFPGTHKVRVKPFGSDFVVYISDFHRSQRMTRVGNFSKVRTWFEPDADNRQRCITTLRQATHYLSDPAIPCVVVRLMLFDDATFRSALSMFLSKCVSRVVTYIPPNYPHEPMFHVAVFSSTIDALHPMCTGLPPNKEHFSPVEIDSFSSISTVFNFAPFDSDGKTNYVDYIFHSLRHTPVDTVYLYRVNAFTRSWGEVFRYAQFTGHYLTSAMCLAFNTLLSTVYSSRNNGVGHLTLISSLDGIKFSDLQKKQFQLEGVRSSSKSFRAESLGL